MLFGLQLETMGTWIRWMALGAGNLASCSVLAPLPNAQQLTLLVSVVLAQFSGRKGDAYNILWMLVFGFSTLNILSLVTKRMEPSHNRVALGEIIAVSVVLVALTLLGWEMLNLFHIFPIKLRPR